MLISFIDFFRNIWLLSYPYSLWSYQKDIDFSGLGLIAVFLSIMDVIKSGVLIVENSSGEKIRFRGGLISRG